MQNQFSVKVFLHLVRYFKYLKIFQQRIDFSKKKCHYLPLFVTLYFVLYKKLNYNKRENGVSQESY